MSNVVQFTLFNPFQYTQHNLIASVKSHEIVLLLFDISNASSFDWAESHAALIASQKKSPPSVVLLGTKLDLDFRREIDEERARQLADKFGWHYFEVSTADQSLMDMVSRRTKVILD